MTTSVFPTAFVRVPLAPYESIQDLDWTRLTSLIRQPTFLEALYLASPALHEEAIKLDFTRLPGEKDKRILYALIKYLIRYSTRCTPFGLFSGFSTLAVASGPTQLRIQPSVTPRKVTRLDMNYLCALAQDLENHPALQPHLRFFPNSSLYVVNDQYRYISYRYDQAGQRSHQLSSADRSDYLATVLQTAQPGTTLRQLEMALVSDEISEEDARAFVQQIVQAQLLVSELEPAVTGDDFLVQILTRLQAIHQQHPADNLTTLIDQLTVLKTSLKAIEKETGPNPAIDQLTAIESQLSPFATPFDRKALFQIDAYLPSIGGQVNQGLLNKLVAKIPTLMTLSATGNPKLDTFRNLFYEKYEEEEVPLVIALDPELGLGYPAGQAGADLSPLLDNIETDRINETQTLTIPVEQRYLFRKIADAQVTNSYQLVIQEEELRTMQPRRTDLPLTNSAMFSVIREKGREQLVLNHFGGATGTQLLGRFGHTDPSVAALLHDISRAEDEARPDLIFADLVHLPEARTGNVIIRPALKCYQIPYLGNASVDQDHQIPVTDLMVSVRGNSIRLRSKSLNKTVIPRLANAHNYSHPDSLDLYHFLCDLQGQNQRLSLSNFIGNASSVFVFIPRIVLDNLILVEAQWNFRDHHVKPLVTAFRTGQWSSLSEEIDRWRAQFRIPRYITLADSDNELYVDLENAWLAETFVNEIKSRPTFTIKEFLYSAETAVVHSEQGWHTNQFVVAFKNRTNKPSPPTNKPFFSPDHQLVTRKFFAGSEWLYYKIYTGIKTADWLLTEVMRPLTERFKTSGWIDQFFFIRLSDPDHHFRFRFHLTDVAFLGNLVCEFHDALAPYLANRSVTSVETATYNRELERYGRHSILTAEAFFHVDSQTVLDFLSQIEGAEGEECRWQFGMKMMHELLDAFELDWPERLAFTEQQTAMFGREFGYNATRKKQLDSRYKEIESSIAALFNETSNDQRFFYALSHQRTRQSEPMISYFRSLHQQGALEMPLESLLDSLIHMTINRLFCHRQRQVEYALYYHLHKYYRITYGRMAHGHRPKTVSPPYPKPKAYEAVS
ncbi:hypothetical protein GCM10027347_41730 [Larkinella harenae]